MTPAFSHQHQSLYVEIHRASYGLRIDTILV